MERSHIEFEDLVEAATRGVFRALGAREADARRAAPTAEELRLPGFPGHIIIGIIFRPQEPEL